MSNDQFLNPEITKKTQELEAELFKRAEDMKVVALWAAEASEALAKIKKLKDEAAAIREELYPCVIHARELERILGEEEMLRIYGMDFQIEETKDDKKKGADAGAKEAAPAAPNAAPTPEKKPNKP